MRLSRGGIIRISAGALIGLSMLLSWTAVSRMSVTVDEFQALPAGLAVLETGDFRYPTGTPFLSEVLPAVPLRWAGESIGTLAKFPEMTSWSLAYYFSLIEGARFPALYGPARAVSLLFLGLSLLLVFAYASRLYGSAGGLAALAVAGLCPNLLGHGALVTPDIYLTCASLAYLWSLDRLARRASWAYAVFLGASLAFAALVKLTGIVFFPLAPLLLWRVSPRRNWRRLRIRLPAALFLGFLGIHAAYLFEGSFGRIGDYAFISPELRALQTRLPSTLPVPLPRHYLRAFDEQLNDSKYPAFLDGQFNRQGFYSYYLVALLVKTPWPTLALALLAWSARWRPTRREQLFLYFFFGLILFFSLGRHKNIGVRYILFLFPILATWCGRLAAGPRQAWRTGVGIFLALFLVGGTLAAWPDYIAYFSPIVGGGDEGHRYLLDSNLDWGQGLLELKRFLDEHQVPKISLAYAGRMRPELYGISYQALRDGTPQKSVVAISANLLWGRTYYMNGSLYWPKDRDAYAAYRVRTPWAILGHSIYVFPAGPSEIIQK